MNLAADYKIFRTIYPVVVDNDWVLLGQVPAWVDSVYRGGFASLECRAVARALDMSSVVGTCVIQIVEVTDAGVSIASSHSVTYGVPWVATIPAVFALRVASATGTPGRMTLTGRGL